VALSVAVTMRTTRPTTTRPSGSLSISARADLLERRSATHDVAEWDALRQCPLPHHQCPMADVLRTGVSVREQEVHIERPNGVRGIALVDIEALRDGAGNIVGAVNCWTSPAASLQGR